MGNSLSVYLKSEGTAGLPKLKSGLMKVVWFFLFCNPMLQRL